MIAEPGGGTSCPACFSHEAVGRILGRTRAEGVDLVETQMKAAVEAGELTSSEQSALASIIQLTRDEEWNTAKSELRELLEAQIQ